MARSLAALEQTVEQSVREPDNSMDPTMREAADRGRDDGRYIRGGSGCWLEGDLVPEGFKLGDQTAGFSFGVQRRSK